jgi:hypothetical protein
MDVNRPCGVRKSKTNPNPYTKEELVELAVDLGYTKTEAKKMTVKELCEMLKKKPKKTVKKSIRKSVRKVSKKTVRKSPKKSVRKVSKKTVRKSPKKSVRKSSRKSPRKSVRKSIRKTVINSSKKSPRKSVRKSSKKSPKKSVRKYLRKSLIKSSRKSSRKSVRKSSRKSVRKSSRKSVRKSSRKFPKKSPIESVRKSSRKSIIISKSLPNECKNDTDILSLEEINDLPKNKLIKTWNDNCYNIDYLIEYLIANNNLNKDPIQPIFDLWRNDKEMNKIINHKGIDKDIKKRYNEMLKKNVLDENEFAQNLSLDDEQIKFINNIALIGSVFLNLSLDEINEGLQKFLEILNKKKDKNRWLDVNIYNLNLRDIINSIKDTCNHQIGRTFLKYYIGLYYLITQNFKKSLELSRYFIKSNDELYITYRYGESVDISGEKGMGGTDISLVPVFVNKNRLHIGEPSKGYFVIYEDYFYLVSGEDFEKIKVNMDTSKGNLSKIRRIIIANYKESKKLDFK